MDRNFSAIVVAAEVAGMAAGEAVRPVPMIVSGGGQQYFVGEGVCGFAWVEFAGNTAFGRYMKKAGKASKHYPKGLSVWVGQFGQSMQRKEAYADAYAKVLRANGIEAYAGSRMD